MWWDSRRRSATARRVRKALASTAGCAEEEPSAGTQSQGTVDFKMRPCQLHIDGGSAARFFYCAKATNADRDAGLDACKKLAAGMVSNTSGQQMTRRDEGDQVAPKGEQPAETTDYANEVVEMAMAHRHQEQGRGCLPPCAASGQATPVHGGVGHVSGPELRQRGVAAGALSSPTPRRLGSRTARPQCCRTE